MLPSPRASGHGVAGPDAVAAAGAPHLVPGRRAHHQQHAGLRALVPPGAAQPREAGRVSCGQRRGWGGTSGKDGAGPGYGGGTWPVERGGTLRKGGAGPRAGLGQWGGAGPRGRMGRDAGTGSDWDSREEGSFWRKDGAGPAEKGWKARL